MKKSFCTRILTFILCGVCLPLGLQAFAQEESSEEQFVVLKVINAEDETKPIAVTLLHIGRNSAHAVVNGKMGVLSDTCVIGEGNDELINRVCQTVDYGDIIEYRGSGLVFTQGTMYNLTSRYENNDSDSFEKIGTIFDNPTSDAESKIVDGESVIAVHPADGSTYLIGRGAEADKILVEVELLGDVNSDDTVNASDAAVILISAAEVGAGEELGLTDVQKAAADFNSDGVINASDAAQVLIQAAKAGAGA